MTDSDTLEFYKHLDGTWKRNLEWRHFGNAYQHLRTSNTIVQINKHTSRKDGRMFLTWSFGLDLSEDSMKFGYVMKVEPSVSPYAVHFNFGYRGTDLSTLKLSNLCVNYVF